MTEISISGLAGHQVKPELGDRGCKTGLTLGYRLRNRTVPVTAGG